MAKLPVKVPRLVTASAVHAVRAAIRDAQRLGLLWRLRPGTVGGTLPAQPESVPVQLDGDSSTIYARSMVGSVMPRQRVWCVQIPPAGIYVLGIIGVSRSAPTTETITASGDYVQPRGLTFIRGVICGGGGAGGGAVATAAGQSSMGGGGGGGATAEFLMAAEDFSHTTTVTIGAGGIGVSGANGGAGGTTSFGGLVTAGGGAGGAARAASAVSHGVEAGDGSNTIGGTFTAAVLHSGTAGSAGWGSGVSHFGVSGSGGASHLGGGGRGRRTTTAGQSLAGVAGRAFGGGGGGSINVAGAAIAGANGAAGVAMIQEFYI